MFSDAQFVARNVQSFTRFSTACSVLLTLQHGIFSHAHFVAWHVQSCTLCSMACSVMHSSVNAAP